MVGIMQSFPFGALKQPIFMGKLMLVFEKIGTRKLGSVEGDFFWADCTMVNHHQTHHLGQYCLLFPSISRKAQKMIVVI